MSTIDANQENLTAQTGTLPSPSLGAPATSPGSDQRLLDNGHGSTVPSDHLLTPGTQVDEQHLLPAPKANVDGNGNGETMSRTNHGPGKADAPPANPQQKPDPDKPKPGNLWLIAGIAILVLLLLLLIGVVQRLHSRSNVKKAQTSQTNGQQSVQVVSPSKAPAFQDAIIPGDIQAVQQTSINAQASGYVQKVLVDIGDKVKAGEVLAIIETPDLNQQVAQARAQLVASQAQLAQSRAGVVGQQGNLAQAEANLARSESSVAQAREQVAQAQAQLAQSRESAAQQRSNLTQAKANRDLALVTNKRYQNLVREGAVDQETADQQAATYQTSQANVDALQAALNASISNILSFQAGVNAAVANVKAFQGGVAASQAAVATAIANVSAARSVVASSIANVTSNQANLKRLIVLQGYNRVTAPFTGVITARNIDNGALIGSSGAEASGSGDSSGSAGAGVGSSGSAASGGSTLGSSSNASSSSNSSLASSSSSSGTSAGASGSLFSEAQLGILHIYVNVGESYSAQVHPGTVAKISVASIPGRVFQGTVARTADALDPSSRTLVTEVRLLNPSGILKPGMFSEVAFHLKSAPGLLVPDTTVITNTDNTQVIVVTPDHKLHFQPVTVARDYGNVSLITSGLKGNEQLVATPTDAMLEGQKVQIQQGQAQGPAGQNGQQPQGGQQQSTQKPGGKPAKSGQTGGGKQGGGGSGGSPQAQGGGPETQSDAGAGTFLPQSAGPTAGQVNASSNPAARGGKKDGSGGGG